MQWFKIPPERHKYFRFYEMETRDKTACVLCITLELAEEQEKTVFIHVWMGGKDPRKGGQEMAGKGELAAQGPEMEGTLFLVGLFMPSDP